MEGQTKNFFDQEAKLSFFFLELGLNGGLHILFSTLLLCKLIEHMMEVTVAMDQNTDTIYFVEYATIQQRKSQNSPFTQFNKKTESLGFTRLIYHVNGHPFFAFEAERSKVKKKKKVNSPLLETLCRLPRSRHRLACWDDRK